MYVCRIQEVILQYSRGIVTLLVKTKQKPRKWAIRKIFMSGVSGTKLLMINNAPYYFVLNTKRCHMLILILSLAFLLTLMYDTEGLQEWSSRRVKYKNTSVCLLNNPHQLKNNSTCLIRFEICTMSSNNALRRDEQYLLHTTFLIL